MHALLSILGLSRQSSVWMSPRYLSRRWFLSLFLSLSLPLAVSAAPTDPGVAQAVEVSSSASASTSASTAAILSGRFPGAAWGRADPAQSGWSADGLAEARQYADKVGSTSVMIVQHGEIIDEWGDTKVRTPLYSARKSILSGLIGIAVDRKQIRLDETLEQAGIDDNAPALTPTEKQATIRQLIEARSGVYHPTVYETPWMKSIKPERGSHAPGTYWLYNNWDFNTAGGIYEKATGVSIFQALQDEIATPIGMQDYRPSDGKYVSGEPDSRYPAYTINMSARDLARFALLFLNDGRWNDKQIIPAAWVEESTRSYSDTPYGGYGYMWWTSDPASGVRGRDATIIRRAYWADGHLGQFAIVVPSLDLVVVSRVDPKQTSKQVGEQKKAKLLWLIETAAHAPDIGPEPVIH